MRKLVTSSVCRSGRWIALRGGRGMLLSLILLSASVALAQLTTGTISGTVMDASGAAVPGAAIVITNVNTGITRNTTSGPAGRYEAPNLPIGQYEVRASLTGFQTSIRAGIELTVGRNAVVDHALQVGEVTQQVTVTGEAPLVETSSATVSQLVDAQRVEDLPLNNRDLTQLSFLQPGVIKIPRSDEFTIFGGSGDTLSVGGARSNQNVYLLDGVTNSDLSGNAQGASGAYSGAETVKEFQIITNNYSAEYRSQAGAIISAVTKSGTNAFHGSVFEFLRNDNFDATNFFDNKFGNKKSEFKRNQFGGAVGGPIIRDRTFFFASYEGTRERLGTPDSAVVLSAEARQGIIPGQNPIEVSPLIRPYLDLWPLPGQGNSVVEDFGDGTVRIAGPKRQPINDDYFLGRFDHQFSGQRAGFLSGTYNYDDSDRSPFGLLGDVTEDGVNGGNGAVSRKHVLSIQHTSVLTPTMLNEFNFGYSWTENAGDVALSTRDTSSLAFNPTRDLVGQLVVPDVLDSVGFRVGGSTYHQKPLTFKDGLSITRGNHSFRMGAEINRFKYDQQSCSRGCNGIYEFRNLRNLLTAVPRRLDIMLPESDNPVRNLAQIIFGAYFQDNWQVMPSFTLNLGMRYEFATVPAEDDNLVSALRNFGDSYVSVHPSLRERYPLQSDLFVGEVDQYFRNPTLKSFSPRFGFAWAPGNRRTSLRGGFGIFYEHPMLYTLRTSLQELPPFSVVGRIDSSSLRFPDAFTTQQELLRARPNIRTVEYDMKTMYMYRWSLTLQREFLNEWMVSAGYTGSRGLHLFGQNLPNINKWEGWPNNPTGPKYFPEVEDDNFINPNFGEVRLQSTQGSSYYHGLALSTQKRLSRGIQFQTSYNFSHAIDQGSGVTSTGEALPQSQRGVYHWDMHLKRGPAAFDIKHNFVANFSYEPTFGQNLTGAARHIVGGWQLNGILTLTSGNPLSVLDDASDAQTSRIGDPENLHANLIPGGNNNPVLGGPDRYYDVSQFAPSTTGFFGTVGPGTVRSPGLATFDLSLFKNFNVTENNTFQFRAEFFNIFNRANFHTPEMTAFGPDGDVNPSAGEITRTRTANRQIQFALKYIF